MRGIKCFIFLLTGCMLWACAGKQSSLVGEWQYVRMERPDLQKNYDTLQIALMESVYRGSLLRFYEDATFVMSKQDSATSFEGRGTYALDTQAQTLTMEGNVRNSSKDQMTVHVYELSADSLKIGSPEEVFIYRRMPE